MASLAKARKRAWLVVILPLPPFSPFPPPSPPPMGVRYTVGTMLYDQAEADINCQRMDVYPCMQEQLVKSYREGFNSSFAFIAVQLPGYVLALADHALAQC